MRYTEANRLLFHRGHGGRIESRKLANNTYLERRPDDNDALAIRLHNTDVVTLHRPTEDTELVTLDTGGWLTVTTKGRMHTYAPGIRIESDRGVWQVAILDPDGDTIQVTPDSYPRPFVVVYPYADGFTYDLTTGMATAPTMDLVYAVERANAKDRDTLDAIRDFVKGFTEPHILAHVGQQLLDGNLAGDCWYCLMVDEDGVTWGDRNADHDHLWSHLDEDYYVPTLAVHATRERGYGDPDFVIGLRARDWVDGRGRSADAFADDLSDYLKRRLLVGSHSKRSPGNRTPTGYFGMR